MNTIKQLIEQLNAQGIEIFVRQGSLKTKSAAGAITPQIAGQIKGNKQAIIDYLEAQEKASRLTRLSDEQRASKIPLSAAQKRLWFVDSLEGKAQHYYLSVAFNLTGTLNVEALGAAFNDLVMRHEVLRTTYHGGEGEVYATILAQLNVTDLNLVMAYEDLSQLTDDKRQQQCKGLVSELGTKKFDLSQDLMLRSLLIKLSEQDYVLALTQHHIASDGFSADLLVHELSLCYQQRLNSIGKSNKLPPIEFQYADYAAFMQYPANQQKQAEQLDYWTKQLANIPQVHSLNLSYPRPVKRTFDGKAFEVNLSSQHSAQVLALAAKLSVSPYMLLHSVFVALLARFSLQQDIVVGTPVSGRDLSECQTMLGLFVNSLVLRSDVTQAMGFDQLIAQSKTVIGDALSHANAPFDKVVEAVNPERSVSHEPLFQIQYLYENVDNRQLNLPGLTVNHIKDEVTVTRFDLELAVIERAGQLTTIWTYNTNLFADLSIEAMAGHFCTLLAGVCADPTKSVGAYGLLDEQQHQRIVKHWNDTKADYQVTQTLHGLFINSLIENPDAIAIIDEDGPMSYLQLYGAVDELITKLTPLAIAPEELVAVRLAKGRSQVVATLAIMMLGGAYLPLEVSWPQGRCDNVLEQANCRYVLINSCQDALNQPSALQGKAELIDMAELSLVFNQDDKQNLQSTNSTLLAKVKAWQETAWQETVKLDALAYVIFTSGSTGKPKGVAIEHQSAVNTILDINSQYQVGASDKVLVVSALSFDLSVYDIFGLLGCGGTVVFPHHQLAKEPTHWLDCVEHHQITIWDTVPTSAAMLVELLIAEQRQCKSKVRHIMMSGDWIAPSLPPKLHQHFPDALVHSLGGATEGSIWSIHYLIDQDTSNWPSIPYGKPLSNQQFYILNDNLQPCPVGVDGQLFIGGLGVAREYYNAPDLTAGSYIVHPQLQQRLYRTGDMGRYRADGNIIFVGRNDHQVKVRGFRIELGEIEVQLKQLAIVSNCLVKICGEGQKARIVAYLVLNPECGWYQLPQGQLFAAIKESLGQSLADYMIPSTFIVIEAFTLTANGKIDHKALIEPDEVQLNVIEYVAPQTPLQHQVVAIFEQILETQQLGIDDDFFELGGHSLLANKIVTQLRQLTQVHVPLKAIFERPTVRGLCALIDDLQSENSALENGANRNQRPALVPRAKGEPLSVSYAQQRMWLDQQASVDSPKYNMVTAFEITGDIDAQRLTDAIIMVLERHDVLRSVYHFTHEQLQVSLKSATDFTLVEQDLTQLPHQQQQQALIQLSNEHMLQAFDLSADLLLAVTLVWLSETQAVLLVRLHHIAADGLSVALLVNDICTAYGLDANQAKRLERPPLQYSDYAKWQRSWLSDQLIDEQLSYWQNYLTNMPVLHQLPLSASRPAVQSFDARSLYFSIDAALVGKVKQLAASEQVTLFSLVQTAFAAILTHFSATNDIVIGTPVSGRDDKALEDMIGLFLNLVLIRTKVNSEQSFSELLVKNNRDILAGFEHQDLPFDQLLEALKPERSMSHNPLCQIKFVLQNYDQGQFNMPGLKVEPKTFDNQVTRFDLDLTVLEHKGDKNNGLTFEWTYKRELFSESFITKMATSLNRLLALLTEQIDTEQQNCGQKAPILIAELLTKACQSASDANGQSLLQGKEDLTHRQSSLIELIAEQAMSTPDNTAYICAKTDASISYKQLMQRVNRLAVGLEQLDIATGDRVAILAPRSIEAMIAMLGVMRSGATYIPIEPSLNDLRVNEIIKDADAEVVLMHSSLSGKVDTSGIDTFVIDDCAHDDNWFAEFANMEGQMPYPKGADIAYIIYTSGSTGKPKGVMISHLALTDYCVYAKDNYYAPACDLGSRSELNGSVVVTSHGFDIGIPALYVPLLCGGQVLLTPMGGEIEYLAEFLQDANSENALIRLTPSHLVALNALLAHSEVKSEDDSETQSKPLDSAHVFVIGGEALDHAHIYPLSQQLPQAKFYNHYGPTEAVVGCLIKPINRADITTSGSIPIGKPMDNTRCLVVDEHLLPVDESLSGQLLVGGLCLAQGYVNQPKLTEQKFISLNGHSYYQTGDRVRINQQGDIEFIERIDKQVNLDGYRIELSDIQSHILTCPQVSQAVVTVKQHNDRDRLVAYVCTENQLDSAKVSELLQQHLVPLLPSYMMPWAYIALEQLPLTANGKVDINALPALTSKESENEHVAPVNQLQRQLCEVFAQVLNKNAQSIGIKDNFFALGGDSIIAIQAVAKGSKFGIKFSLADIFAYPTVASLSAYLSENLANAQSTVEVVPSTGQMPLLPMQQAFLNRQLGNAHHYNQSLLLTVPSDFDINQLQQIFAPIVATHDVLRAHLTHECGGNGGKGNDKQVYLSFVEDQLNWLNLALTEVDLSQDDVSEQAHLLEQSLQNIQRSFDLADGPLFKVCLINLADNTKRLFLCFHHLLIDGVSWRILLADLESLFNQLTQPSQPTRPLSIANQTCSMQMWQQTLQSYCQSRRFTQQHAFWLEQISSDVSNWPTGLLADRPQKGEHSAPSVKRQSYQFTLASSLTEQLLTDANSAYNTNVEQLLLAALTLALTQWTGVRVFRFYLESHGRAALGKQRSEQIDEQRAEQLDLSRMMGWLTSYYPLLINAQAANTAEQNQAEVIKQVKEQHRQIVDNGIGYQLFKDTLNNQAIAEAAKQSSPYSIEFNYLGQFDADINQGGDQSNNQNSPFSVAPESRGDDVCPLQAKRSPLYVNAIVSGGQLQLNLDVELNVINGASAAELIGLIEQHLGTTVQHCMIIAQLKSSQSSNQSLPQSAPVGESVEEFSI